MLRAGIRVGRGLVRVSVAVPAQRRRCGLHRVPQWLKPCSLFRGLVWHESTRALPGRGGLRVRGSASAVLGLPQRLKPRSLFVGFYGTSKLLPFPSLLVTSFAETRHDHAREGHDFQSCRKRVLRHAALAAEGQVSSLKPG